MSELSGLALFACYVLASLLAVYLIARWFGS